MWKPRAANSLFLSITVNLAYSLYFSGILSMPEWIGEKWRDYGNLLLVCLDGGNVMVPLLTLKSVGHGQWAYSWLGPQAQMAFDVLSISRKNIGSHITMVTCTQNVKCILHVHVQPTYVNVTIMLPTTVIKSFLWNLSSQNTYLSIHVDVTHLYHQARVMKAGRGSLGLGSWWRGWRMIGSPGRW